jgi:hypothetical protein
VLSADGAEIQAIAGLLHDAAEDQGDQATLEVIRIRFGAEVAQIVSDCTDSWVDPKPAWRPRKDFPIGLAAASAAMARFGLLGMSVKVVFVI